MFAAKVDRTHVERVTTRFYRPELDGLRFFAFLVVLIHHGPSSPGLPDMVTRAGAFGLSMFFLLSAYLITELLVREREQTGTIAWRLFFTRRALRIWPLYYAALAGAFVIGQIYGHHMWMSGWSATAMAFFVANWFRLPEQLSSLVAPLWSISVEEQFYLIWPPILKAGGKKLAFVAAILFLVVAAIYIPAFSARGWKLWYDTPVEFIFFAAGVLIALATHRRPEIRLGGAARAILLAAGLAALAAAAHYGGIGTDHEEGITAAQAYAGFGGALVGCSLIFYSTLGIRRIPEPLIYLGKISYGLYVFHAAIIGILEKVTASLEPRVSTLSYMVLVDVLALAASILAAHLSYRYFEKPFLKLKERFEVVRSRPA